MFKSKLRIIVVISVFCSSVLHAQQKQIKTKTEIFSNSLQGILYKTVYSYNDNGVLFKQVKYNHTGTILSSIKFKYNSKDLLKSELKYNAKDSLVEANYFEYDSLGTKISNMQVLPFTNSRSEENRAVLYNKKGQVLKIMELDSLQKKVGVYAYKYTKAGQKKKCVYSENDVLLKKWKFKNEQNRIVNEVLYVYKDKKKIKNSISSYSYSTSGDLLLKSVYLVADYMPTPVAQYYHYYYNNEGQLVGIILMQGGKKMNKIEYLYTYY